CRFYDSRLPVALPATLATAHAALHLNVRGTTVVLKKPGCRTTRAKPSIGVGGPQEYQAYQQLRAANNIANENLETAEMYQDAEMQWGAWGGWGMGWGPMGMGVGVGRFR